MYRTTLPSTGLESLSAGELEVGYLWIWVALSRKECLKNTCADRADPQMRNRKLRVLVIHKCRITFHKCNFRFYKWHFIYKYTSIFVKINIRVTNRIFLFVDIKTHMQIKKYLWISLCAYTNIIETNLAPYCSNRLT